MGGTGGLESFWVSVQGSRVEVLVSGLRVSESQTSSPKP